MIALIDLDFALYTSVHKIVSISEMKRAIALHGKKGAKQWLLETVYNEGIKRVEDRIGEIKLHLEEYMFCENITTELFITTNKNCFRKKLSSAYKAKRKRNKYVWLLRSHYMINDAKYSDTLEADDLVAIRARELGAKNCIVVSPDKDLKTIGGFYWSYYKQKSKDIFGDEIINEFGYAETEFKQKEPIFISESEANYLFWKQMLMGDTSDNIKGLHRIGEKTAQKILKDKQNLFIATARKYIEKDQKNDFWINYKLLKLG
jgi:5'-3' exonuclease